MNNKSIPTLKISNIALAKESKKKAGLIRKQKKTQEEHQYLTFNQEKANISMRETDKP